MTDYSKMIDFEINKLVALSIGGFESEDIFQLQGVIFKRHGKFQYSFFDPCNNPSDAWPIIVENNIAIVPCRHAIPQAWPTKFGIASKFLVEDRNPLRAAMIVYLMMKEGENGI